MPILGRIRRCTRRRVVAGAALTLILIESFLPSRLAVAQQTLTPSGATTPRVPPLGSPAPQTPAFPSPAQISAPPSTGASQAAPGAALRPGQAPVGAGQAVTVTTTVPGPETTPKGPRVEEVPSPIETTFQTIMGVEAAQRLRQFGYDVFQLPASTFAPVEDVPVGPDYVLGPGDSLTIYVWGLVENVFTEEINRNGEIFIPRVGTLKLWGLSFEKADELIREQLSRAFTGFQVSVTLGRLRTIRVFVVGELTRPGAYTLSALSTVTNALFAAGGPSKQGTLRGIRLLRNNQPVTELDFYDFLLRGDKSHDVRLESGDTVFVPTLGPVVGLAGNVNRPAIYELKGETQATDLLAMAGGVSPGGYLQRLQLERYRANTDRVIQDFSLLDFTQRGLREGNPTLRDGDLLRILPVFPRIYNTVRLEGSVKRPGGYELRPGMRLGDILTPDEVLPEAFLERAEIVRLKEDLSTEVIPFSVREVFAGQTAANLELRSQDRVVIKSEFRPGGFVDVTGQIKRPGRYAIVRGERLSSLLERAGGFLPEAFPKGAVFTRESLRQMERQELDKFVRAQEQSLLAEISGVTAGLVETTSTPSEGGIASAQAGLLSQRRELIRSLATVTTVGRLAIRVDSPDKLKGSPDDILLEEGDTLHIPQQPTSVLVLGSVRNSTSILFKEGETTDYYLAKAGGLRREADFDQAYIIKPDGSAISGFTKVRQIEAGDTIIVPVSTEPRYRAIPVLKDLATIVGGFTLPLAAVLAISK